ncbi:MAG TPA: phosphomannomutase/phosphoglucomutase [Myxococcota bacterium]|nr:phosphomannomutase/phosphoglucomutase [Myxococcota bacterium]HOA14428.1 phosphomannomutase/phosphoglucomutase [Myxococcota bacterium]HOH77661.1 phosphomannomutase/phosphoglucomutase [Myxococcota bacterium]
MGRLNPLIFREYDIRGLVGPDLDDDTVGTIARAFGTWLRGHGATRAVVGADCRLSSPGFREVVIAGLNDTGIDVIDLGMVTTPLTYFALHHLDIGAGIMITGSHNPKEFNGLKMCAGKKSVFGAQIQEIRRIAESGQFLHGRGGRRTFDIVPDYMERIVSDCRIRPERRFKVVVDAGNGTGGITAVPLLRRLGCEVIEIFCSPDGNFPNHHPDPTVMENLVHLQEAVVSNGADVGFGFDGDADRIGVVAEDGSVVMGDMILLTLALDLLKELPGAEIVSEVKGSQVLFEQVKLAGGRPVMWKVGHSLIKARMAETDVPLGGEISGHMFFNYRWYGFDDAVYAATRYLEVLDAFSGPASAMLASIPKTFSTPELRVDCPDQIKVDVVEHLKDHYQGAGHDVVTIDGARVLFQGGWGLVRASNTQPVLVLRFEADTPENLEIIRSDMMERAAAAVRSFS